MALVCVFALAACKRYDPKTDVTSKEFDAAAYKSKLMDDAQNAAIPDIRVEEARISAVTALEAFQGYDTAVDFTFALNGAAPSWWGVNSSDEYTSRGEVLTEDNRKIVVAVRCEAPREARVSSRTPVPPEETRYESRYIFRLKGKRGPLMLKDDLPFFFGKTPIPNAIVHIEQPILKSGETGKGVSPDKTLGARIEFLKLEKTSGQSAELTLKYLRIVMRRKSGTKTEVVDESGKVWPVKPTFGWGSGELEGDGDLEVRRMNFDLSSIPVSAGALTLRGYAYSDDFWPSSFTMRLRDNSGKILASTQDFSRPKSRKTWRVVSSRTFPSYPNTRKTMRRIEIMIEALPGEQLASNRGWNLGEGAILVSGDAKIPLRFQQAYYERHTPKCMLLMDVDMPPQSIKFPSRLQVKITDDKGVSSPISVPLEK